MRKLATMQAITVALLAGCGDDEEPASSSDSGSEQLVISAASSLEPAFTAYADEAGFDAKQSFAGSDDLAAQIRGGVTPDLYAAANTSLPDELFADGLLAEPVVFAGNELGLAVPADNEAEIESIEDLARGDLELAIGDEGVPVGDYTREVLARLPGGQGEQILANVRSNEPDVAGIVGKLSQGAVDAGFVYVTDVVATDGELEAIELPTELQPEVAYGVAVVEGAENPEGAQEFIDGLLDGAGADALADAGFLPPPSE